MLSPNVSRAPTLSFEDNALSPSPTILGDSKDDKAYINEKQDLEASQTALSPNALSPARKYLVLLVLSGALFFDIYNACAVFTALPTVSGHLRLSCLYSLTSTIPCSLGKNSGSQPLIFNGLPQATP